MKQNLTNKELSAYGFSRCKAPQNDRGENGRSMVEILGVLAIVGILSATGIYAYQHAISQHKANQIWQDVLLRATAIRLIPDYNRDIGDSSDWTILHEKLGFGKWGWGTSSGYSINGVLNDDGSWKNGVFHLVVHDVPENVCHKVIEMRPNERILIGLTRHGFNNTCPTGINDISFYFDFMRNPCYSICEKFETEWYNKCGTEWPDCDRRLGFKCNHAAMEHASCPDSLRYTCYLEAIDKTAARNTEARKKYLHEYICH